MTHAKTIVALVGNAAPRIDHSPLIEAAQLVIRFNNATHLHTGLVGGRTDVLYARSATGEHGQRLLTDPEFSIPDRVCQETQLLRIVGAQHVPDSAKDGMSPFLPLFPNCRISRFIPAEEYTAWTPESLRDAPILSIGMVAVLNQLRFRFNYVEYHLFNFYYDVLETEGADGCHWWNAERDYIHFLPATGRVVLHP